MSVAAHSEDEDEFQDAYEETPVAGSMDLRQSISETQIALNLFLNNRFEAARVKMEPWSKTSMYHALGHCTVHYIRAMMTCDPERGKLIAQHYEQALKLSEERARREVVSVRESAERELATTRIAAEQQRINLQADLARHRDFAKVDVEKAVEQCKEAVGVANSARRPGNFISDQWSQVSRLVYRSTSASTGGSKSLTDEEMHAELCYAESLLQRALLSFIQDENLSSFVKGALKIRQCYNSYRECQRLMESVDWAGRDPLLRLHFESGVKMGLGTFNLLIASLPARVLRLLEFVGFSGDKRTGLLMLEEGAAMRESLRSPLCSLVLLTWHLVAVYLFGTSHGDLKLCQKLLAPMLAAYPNGALVLYYAGRLNVVTGRIESGIACFDSSVAAQGEWRQFHHLCYWELMFAQAYSRRWDAAAHFAYRLYRENRWSKATYAYMGGVFLLAKRPENLDWEERERMETLLASVPGLRVRIAGKSLPIEKFAAAKAARYSRTKALVLPHYSLEELLYLWNGFRVLATCEDLLLPIHKEIEAALTKARLFAPEPKSPGSLDDVCLCLLLKALSLRFLQSPFQAEQCLLEVTNSEKSLSGEASYLVPNAWLELAILRMEEGKLDEARKALNQARGYKNYLLATRLHFRAHALGELLSAATPLDGRPPFT